MNKLKELREEYKKSQQQIADMLNVTRAAYSRYEKGQRSVPIEILWKLADYYKVNIDYLVGREE